MDYLISLPTFSYTDIGFQTTKIEDDAVYRVSIFSLWYNA